MHLVGAIQGTSLLLKSKPADEKDENVSPHSSHAKSLRQIFLFHIASVAFNGCFLTILLFFCLKSISLSACLQSSCFTLHLLLSMGVF